MIVLNSGDAIRGDAAAATVVDYTIFGLDNNTLKQLADGQLAAAEGDLYTADSVDVITTIVIVNTDSVARAINLFLLPNAGTARRIIAKDLSLGAGYSLHWSGDKISVMNASGQIVTTTASGGVDTSGTPVANDIARFTDADTIEGRSYAELKSDLGLEIGTDVLAQQTIGIANDNLLEVDGSPLDTEVAVFTANGINGLSTTEMKALLTYLQAGDAINMADALLTRPEIKDYSETVKALTIATNTLTLDLEEASVFTWTATDNATTFAITNWLASKSKSLTLFFIQAAAAKTIDWTDESIIWAGGSAPDITTINSKHVICISSPDGGTTKYGFHASSEAA
jgi:hypothetical protein